MKSESATDIQEKGGYIFQNFTGQDLYIAVHDEENSSAIDTTAQKPDYMIS